MIGEESPTLPKLRKSNMASRKKSTSDILLGLSSKDKEKDAASFFDEDEEGDEPEKDDAEKQAFSPAEIDTKLDKELGFEEPEPEEEDVDSEDFMPLTPEDEEVDFEEDEEITPEKYALDSRKEAEDSLPKGLGPTPDRVYDKEEKKPYEYEGPTREAAEALKQEAESEGIQLDDPDDNAQTDEAMDVAFRKIPMYDKADFLLKQDAITEQYLNDIAEAKETYNRTKDEIAQKRIWDGIIKAVALLGAVWYGNKTGLDLSGIKFDKFEYDQMMESAREDLKVAKGFAKDVRDIKQEDLDKRRTAIFAEMEMARSFNRDLMDKAYYDRQKEEFEIKKQTKQAEAAAEDQQDVLEYVKDTNAYKVYSNQKKALEKALQKYSEKPDEDALDSIRSMSKIMQNSADQMTKKLGNRGAFPNEYPENLFESSRKTALFGVFKWQGKPEYTQILEKKAKSLENILSPKDYGLYLKMKKSSNTELKKRAAKALNQKYPGLFTQQK